MTTTNGRHVHATTDYEYDAALQESGDALRALGYLVQACACLTDTEGQQIHHDATLILQAAKELRLRLVKEIADRARKPAAVGF